MASDILNQAYVDPSKGIIISTLELSSDLWPSLYVVRAHEDMDLRLETGAVKKFTALDFDLQEPEKGSPAITGLEFVMPKSFLYARMKVTAGGMVKITHRTFLEGHELDGPQDVLLTLNVDTSSALHYSDNDTISLLATANQLHDRPFPSLQQTPDNTPALATS